MVNCLEDANVYDRIGDIAAIIKRPLHYVISRRALRTLLHRHERVMPLSPSHHVTFQSPL
jgi:hypothetical protein